MSEINYEIIEHLTLGQEAFLFGDQGEIVDPELAADVLHTKLGLALFWLSSYWPKPYPEELVSVEHESRIAAVEILAKWTEEGIFDPQRPKDQVWLEMIEPKHPILLALQVEWRFKDGIQVPIKDREVLTTALIHTHEALAGSSDVNDKLRYVVELVEQNDRHVRDIEKASPWEEPPMPVFPNSIDSYMLGTFPMHGINLDLY